MKKLAVLAFVLGCGHPPRWFGHIARDGEIEPNIAPPKAELALAARDLTSAEHQKLDENGFAILGAGAASSFHVGYTALFHAHKPVYVTADSLLYAWHSSYDKILIDVEQESLIPTLDRMLGELRAGLAKAEADPQTRADLDVYLTVAASFSLGKLAQPVAGGDPAAIAAIFDKGQKAEGGGLELFGDSMDFDFSMLKPRGHYTEFAMPPYFRAMSWLGRAEIRIASKRDPNSPWVVNRRAFRASLLLASLFSQTTRNEWNTIDETLTAFVGAQDSMSLPGLAAGVAALGGNAAQEKSDDQIGAAFAVPAQQKINTQLVQAGQSSIAFLLLGQRFVFDASILGDLVYSSLETKPVRLMPTPLDVAHTAFHNPVAHSLLAPEIAKYGAPYERALASHYAMPIPSDSVYHMWLGALRELSPDAERDATLPKPLASEAWGRRMLSAQLASWAELRHDNLLYAKQSFTVELGCAFPDAYADPYPRFYAAMEALANKAKTAITTSGFHSAREPRLVHYFDGMAKTMAHLRAIAERERANQPLTDDDLDFMNHMVSLDGRNIVCSTTIDPKGWYAELFYEQATAMWNTPVIADVHTQPTNEAGDTVGRVLHVGTGMPRMLEVRIEHDDGKHTETYRGFVSTYAELVTTDFQRMTDEEWRAQIGTKMLGVPPWMSSIMAR